MKILTICSVFPPYAKGGAELSAYNYARWLGNEGHEVSVLTSAKTKSDELHGVEMDGMKIWRLHWPRPYTVHDHDNQPWLSKAIWHLQDHLDPRNARMLSKLVEEVQPEFVNLHLVAGIGHNALSVFKHKTTVPVAYFLHDLGLACIRSTMYSKRSNCERQCTTCRVSSFLKFRQLKNLPAVYFVSPSASNLHSLKSYTPIGDYRTSVIPNLDFDNAILREQGPSDAPLKFMFVGRLHQTKGVEFLLEVFDRIAEEKKQFHLTIVGGGPIEMKLRARYEGNPWVSFSGHIPPVEVKAQMSKADVLCVPSLCRENHPGVVRQALRAGVPAVVSDRGGSSEMIEDGTSGIVLRASDASQWKEALSGLILRRQYVEHLQKNALEASRKYETETVGNQLRTLMNDVLASARPEMLQTPSEPLIPLHHE